MSGESVTFAPLTPERWDDFARLFGPRGAYGGCWCMWFRQTGKKYEAGRGEKNREAMRGIVSTGVAPGILGYVDGEPAGWVAVRPREEYTRLERSRNMKRVDDEPVWSIVCFYIGKEHRGQGLMRVLINAAVEHAAANGARIVESYPLDPAAGPVSTDAGYHGLVPAFVACGFEEVVRRGKGQPVMRKRVA